MAEAAAAVDRIAFWNDGAGAEWREELPALLASADRIAIEEALMPPRLIASLKKVLASKHVFWWVPALAAINLAFGLDVGWMIDDHVHRAALTHHPEFPDWHRSADSLFAFTDGDPERLSDAVARGIWPWWSAPDMHLAFWRPVTGWSHALDYRAWPENPWLMHVHSLAWFLLAVVLLFALYRYVMPRPATASSSRRRSSTRISPIRATSSMQ